MTSRSINLRSDRLLPVGTMAHCVERGMRATESPVGGEAGLVLRTVPELLEN